VGISFFPPDRNSLFGILDGVKRFSNDFNAFAGDRRVAIKWSYGINQLYEEHLGPLGAAAVSGWVMEAIPSFDFFGSDADWLHTALLVFDRLRAVQKLH
jgi:hypothetical protein